jgi:hypothetical protein
MENVLKIARVKSGFCRFVLILLVVANHCQSSGDILFKFTSPALSFLSGFLFVLSFKGVPAKIASTVKGLFIPYLVINLVYYTVYFFIKNTLVRNGLAHLFKSPTPELSMVGLFNGLILNPVNGPFWFLRNLIVAHHISIVLLLLNPHIRLGCVTLIILLFCFMLPGDRFYSSYYFGLLLGLLGNTKIGRFIPIFAGNLVKTTFRKTWSIVSAVTFVFLINSKWTALGPISCLIVGPLTIFALSGIAVNCIYGKHIVSDNYSFFLFAWHSMVVGGIKSVLMYFELQNNVWSQIAWFVASNIVVYLVYKAINRIPICKLFRVGKVESINLA